MPKSCFIAALLCCSYGASGASVEPPKLRLGDDVRPMHYSLNLNLNPDEDTFAGAIEIDLDIRKPADVIWLNAKSLTIDHASLVTGGHTMAARIEKGGEDFAGFAFSTAAPSGKAKLQIAYRGELSKKGTGGLFKLQEGGNWYIYSQFEAVDARRAFPCFDEPSFKVPWQLTLHIKKEHTAVSNTPVLSESNENGARKKVVFAETKPLPSYLVAMAVGPLEFVDAGKVGKKQTPLRIVTPKGEGVQAKYAAQVTREILQQLENYFGIPYPYEKLDGISIPVTFGFGAMENPGLITYAQNIILSDPAQDSINRQRTYAEVAAHEMAHMWFGDLVTTAWWDDIWLNEAFASWMAAKVIHQWKPEWNTKIDEQNSRLDVMEQDSLVSARKIRQPIESNNDIVNAFDNITYSKGQAVIGMFESWMGEDAFRSGVQRYLKQYSWRNATAADFMDALGSSGNQPVGRAFSTFLNQPGVPLVSVKVQCDSASGASLQLNQKRALPLGSQGSSTQQTWQIPVCARYGEGDSTGRECTLLTDTSTRWKLTGAKSCPAWVVVNADGAGYYRTSYEAKQLGSLLADGGRQLSASERVATLGDVEALTRLGEIKAADALILVPQFARDPVRQVVSSAIGITGSVRAHLVPNELFPNYMRFVNQTFGERARQLGWKPKAGEDSETRLLRSSIVPLAAVWGWRPVTCRRSPSTRRTLACGQELD